MRMVKILIVEDDILFRDALVLTLRAGDVFEPVVVGTLSEGLTRVQQEKFSAILLDLDLPDERGIRTVERMRAIVKNVPITILSGNGDKRMIEKAKTAGAVHYIVKDQVTNSLLIDSINMTIERNDKQKAEALTIKYQKEMREIIQNFEELKIRLKESYPVQ
jgi:DNA-binding NarL/FixJ family response regulator